MSKNGKSSTKSKASWLDEDGKGKSSKPAKAAKSKSEDDEDDAEFDAKPKKKAKSREDAEPARKPKKKERKASREEKPAKRSREEAEPVKKAKTKKRAARQSSGMPGRDLLLFLGSKTEKAFHEADGDKDAERSILLPRLKEKGYTKVRFDRHEKKGYRMATGISKSGYHKEFYFKP